MDSMPHNARKSEKEIDGSINGYLDSLLHHTNKQGKVFFTDLTFKYSKNYISVIASNGKLLRFSSSFLNVLGYTMNECSDLSPDKLMPFGDFPINRKQTDFYFQNTFSCKDNSRKNIKWRLIPDAMDDAFVFVGWEL